MSNQNNANRMGVIHVNKLMISMGIPMILSMMLQALYNIVDSAFVSNIAENGEAALNARESFNCRRHFMRNFTYFYAKNPQETH